MTKITTLQKLGIGLVCFSPLVGGIGAVVSVYSSFAALHTSENAGLGSVGGLLTNAILFTAGGLIGTIAGLVLVILGRSKS